MRSVSVFHVPYLLCVSHRFSTTFGARSLQNVPLKKSQIWTTFENFMESIWMTSTSAYHVFAKNTDMMWVFATLAKTQIWTQALTKWPIWPEPIGSYSLFCIHTVAGCNYKVGTIVWFRRVWQVQMCSKNVEGNFNIPMVYCKNVMRPYMNRAFTQIGTITHYLLAFVNTTLQNHELHSFFTRIYW